MIWETWEASISGPLSQSLQITGHRTLTWPYRVNSIPLSGPEFRGTSQNNRLKYILSND